MTENFLKEESNLVSSIFERLLWITLMKPPLHIQDSFPSENCLLSYGRNLPMSQTKASQFG